MQDEIQNGPANDAQPREQHSEYRPPQVECVMDAEELSREVHYAGFTRIS